MENYLKHAYDLNTFYLAYNKIEMIEPKVLAIFKRFRNVRLEGNVCIKESFKLKNCNLNEMRTELKQCFDNYFLAHPEMNTTEQQGIMEAENIPEYLITSGQNSINLKFSHLGISLLIILSLIKSFFEWIFFSPFQFFFNDAFFFCIIYDIFFKNEWKFL